MALVQHAFSQNTSRSELIAQAANEQLQVGFLLTLAAKCASDPRDREQLENLADRAVLIGETLGELGRKRQGIA